MSETEMDTVPGSSTFFIEERLSPCVIKKPLIIMQGFNSLQKSTQIQTLKTRLRVLCNLLYYKNIIIHKMNHGVLDDES
jgi:hypothetical protein